MNDTRRKFLTRGLQTSLGVTALGPLLVPTMGSTIGSTMGCKAVQAALKQMGYTAPSVRVVDMSVSKWGLTELGTTFDVEISNPNPVGFTLRGIQYGLDIDGSRLTSGESKSPVSLKAQGTSTTQLAFDFPLAETANALIALLTKREVGYGLESAFDIGRPDFSVSVPVKKEGRLPLPRLPKFDVADAKVGDVSIAGIEFRIVPTVENPNDFDVPVEGFETSLTLNDRPVIQNRASPATQLKANAKTPVPIALTLSLADLGLSAVSLIRKPQLNWKVDFGLMAGSIKLPFTESGRLRLA